jgi:hypothetical protein
MLQTVDPGAARDAAMPAAAHHVHELRFSLLWPLRVITGDATRRQQRAWEHLGADGASPWHRAQDDDAPFDEARYNAFVTFLPYVQRFLYGEGSGASRESPMRCFVRDDIRHVRLTPQAGDDAVVLDVDEVALAFFYDVDVMLLKVSVHATNLPLDVAQDVLYRFGRGYPGGWNDDGSAQHCMHDVQWLDAQQQVLAASDSQDRDTFLAHVGQHRAPRFARHWSYVLAPLVCGAGGAQSGSKSGPNGRTNAEASGAARVRQIEYYRMPVMAYLAVENPRALTRHDFMRLAFVSGAGTVGSRGAYAEIEDEDFESHCCYDRFWCDSGRAPRTRYLSSGHALVVVGDAKVPFFRDAQRGVRAQFEHQHFTAFLIAHFQKAALLTFSDRLSQAMRALDVSDPDSVKVFKRTIRANYEAFLRFTHRYWFHEVSEQAQMRGLFKLTSRHLELDPLYDEVKVRMSDMNAYLDADSIRRQANTIVRLTVVTILGLIGTITTGFLGMNLIAAADEPGWWRIAAFVLLLAAATALTVATIAKSRRLSDFLDTLSDDRKTWRERLDAFVSVWRS